MTTNNTQTTTTTQLGKAGPRVSRIGLGAMALSGMYGPADDEEGVAVVKAALDAGINFVDTGDFYGSGHNEMLIARAIKGRRDDVILSVKFGALRDPSGDFIGYDNRPVAVKSACAYSLKRLGVDVIDIYRPSRLDPNVPIEDTIGAIVDLQKAGYVRHIGLSEVGVDTIRRATKVAPIVDLQIEYALATRDTEKAIFPALKELGLSATLYGVFGRGLLTGKKPAGKADFRAHLPRFADGKNDDVAARVASFAADLKLTPAQLLIAWALAKEPGFVPLVGARTREQLADALGALRRPLAPAELTALEQLVPADAVSGTRYGALQMQMLDSEKA